jgi:hypothetical protein
MTLASVQSKIDASVAAFRKLRDDDPQDFFEVDKRHGEAADLLDDAQTEGEKLKGKDFEAYREAFGTAWEAIERSEAQRLSGFDGGEDEDLETDDEEPEGIKDSDPEDDVEYEARQKKLEESVTDYSDMAEPAAEE